MPRVLPAGTALDSAAYDRIDALAALFRTATKELQALEAQMKAGTYRRSYLRARIREAQRIIAALLDYRDGVGTGAVVDWARDALPPAYQYGAGLAVRDLRAQALSVVGGSPQIHVRAVASLIDRFVSESTAIVVQLHSNVIRASRVILESAGFGGEIAQGIIGGLPRRHVSRALANSLRRAVMGALPAGADVDITHVELGGRRYLLEYWAEMHARTELARSSTAGTRVLSAVNGVRHVQITTHAHAPCICTPFEGRIYSIEPGDPDYMWIGDVPNGGVPLHPNCVHREAPAVVEYMAERNDLRNRTELPQDFVGLDERELARVVRENRDELARYSRDRDGFMPSGFRLRRAA